MDRALDALVHLDVPADIIRIEVRGTLGHDTRAELIHVIRRIRRMGLRCRICVDLSQAALIESAALSGLRTDLNTMDATSLPGLPGRGVSLELMGTWRDPDAAGTNNTRPLLIEDDVADLFAGRGDFTDGLPQVPVVFFEVLYGRPLADYSDEELLNASDSVFALLDNPQAFDGADLLGRYNDIGLEIVRRQQQPQAPFPAAEGQAAS